jgi:hypothetical protein
VEMIYIIVSALVNLYSCLFWPSYVLPNHDLVKEKKSTKSWWFFPI